MIFREAHGFHRVRPTMGCGVMFILCNTIDNKLALSNLNEISRGGNHPLNEYNIFTYAAILQGGGHIEEDYIAGRWLPEHVGDFFCDGAVARAEGGRHGRGGDEADLGEGGGDEEQDEEQLEPVGAGGAAEARERGEPQPPAVQERGGGGQQLQVAGQPVGRRHRRDEAPQQARRRHRHRTEWIPLLLGLSLSLSLSLSANRGGSGVGWGGRLALAT